MTMLTMLTMLPLLPLLLYILGLHWLIYRLYQRQKAHEIVTLAITKVLASIVSTRLTEPQESHEPSEVH